MFLASWPGGSWEATLKYSIAILAVYLGALWLTLVFWTYRDIRQRTRDPIVQTVAVLLVLVFFLPGHWIYLILRPRYTLSELYERSLEEEALLQELEDQKACPTCKRRVQDEFLICPSCRTQLKEPCRQCSKPLSYAWVSCPYCGLEKAPREGYGPRPARPRSAAARQAAGVSRPSASQHERQPQPKPAPARATKDATREAPRTTARDPFATHSAMGDEPMIGGGAE
jgi:RNA polymerase subunit RPABC4/transcription elongation factor Spt4